MFILNLLFFRKDIDRFIQRQQKIMAKDVKRAVLKPTAGRNADKLKTANDHVNAVFTVQFDVEDRASSFDEEDLSISNFSTENKVK
jgi:hypothetical protein